MHLVISADTSRCYPEVADKNAPGFRIQGLPQPLAEQIDQQVDAYAAGHPETDAPLLAAIKGHLQAEIAKYPERSLQVRAEVRFDIRPVA